MKKYLIKPLKWEKDAYPQGVRFYSATTLLGAYIIEGKEGKFDIIRDWPDDSEDLGSAKTASAAKRICRQDYINLLSDALTETI